MFFLLFCCFVVLLFGCLVVWRTHLRFDYQLNNQTTIHELIFYIANLNNSPKRYSHYSHNNIIREGNDSE